MLGIGSIAVGTNVGSVNIPGKVYYVPVAVTNRSSKSASYHFMLKVSSKTGRPVAAGWKCVLDVLPGKTVHKKVAIIGIRPSEEAKQMLAGAQGAVGEKGVQRFPVGLATS